MLPTLHPGEASSFCSGGSQPAPPHPQWELGPPCPRDTGDTSQIHGHDLWETQEHWTRSLDITVSVLALSQLAVCPRQSHTPSLLWFLENCGAWLGMSQPFWFCALHPSTCQQWPLSDCFLSAEG